MDFLHFYWRTNTSPSGYTKISYQNGNWMEADFSTMPSTDHSIGSGRATMLDILNRWKAEKPGGSFQFSKTFDRSKMIDVVNHSPSGKGFYCSDISDPRIRSAWKPQMLKTLDEVADFIEGQFPELKASNVPAATVQQKKPTIMPKL